jgi:hypothetical protein
VIRAEAAAREGDQICPPLNICADFFLEVGFGVFARGFWGKWVIYRGVLMVNLWWIHGE